MVAEGWRNFATKRIASRRTFSRSSTSVFKKSRGGLMLKAGQYLYLGVMRPELDRKCTQKRTQFWRFSHMHTGNP